MIEQLQKDYRRALEVAPYKDDALVGEVTRSLLDVGYSILQTHKLQPTHEAHVRELFAYMNPPASSRILDCGCGVGEVARIMKDQHPDLEFTLLNISASQLQFAPPGMKKIVSDFQSMPFADGSFDCVMYNFSLGHGLLDKCIGEAHRVLRDYGILFIYDIASDYQQEIIEAAGYRPHSIEEVTRSLLDHKFRAGSMHRPDGTTDEIVAVCGTEHTGWVYKTFPVIYRAIK